MDAVAGTRLFQDEYQHELESWLRKRFRYFCIALLVITAFRLIVTLGDLIGLWDDASAFAVGDLIILADIGLATAVILYYLLPTMGGARRVADADRQRILWHATALILVLGLLRIGANALIQQQQDGTVVVSTIMLLFFWHILACAFLPWRPLESLKPFVPLMALWVGAHLFDGGMLLIGDRIIGILFSPMIFVPGLLICLVRMQRHSEEFSRRMIGRQFHVMRRELSQARQIHESMFPEPYDDGHVDFNYVFEPMRQLGGDYIHLHVSSTGMIHICLLDVTGHGLAAALTVNRLYGELERIRGEDEHVEPAEVLRLLNRYVNLTMARHNVYVTAAAISFDPYMGVLQWANAGHPPGFVRKADGSVTEITSTAVVLGATDADEFHAEQSMFECEPGDVLVLYTDGAFEARDRNGEQLGLGALRKLLRQHPAPRNWPQFLASMVHKHQQGPADDDVLIASLRFAEFRGNTGEPSERELAAAGVDEQQ